MSRKQVTHLTHAAEDQPAVYDVIHEEEGPDGHGWYRYAGMRKGFIAPVSEMVEYEPDPEPGDLCHRRTDMNGRLYKVLRVTPSPDPEVIFRWFGHEQQLGARRAELLKDFRENYTRVEKDHG